MTQHCRMPFRRFNRDFPRQRWPLSMWAGRMRCPFHGHRRRGRPRISERVGPAGNAQTDACARGAIGVALAIVTVQRGSLRWTHAGAPTSGLDVAAGVSGFGMGLRPLVPRRTTQEDRVAPRAETHVRADRIGPNAAAHGPDRIQARSNLCHDIRSRQRSLLRASGAA